MELERGLSTEMTNYTNLKKEMQIIICLSKSERNLRKLADLDSIYM